MSPDDPIKKRFQGGSKIIERFNDAGIEVFHFDQVDSTNDIGLLDKKEIVLPHMFAIWADIQTKGRGRQMRPWRSSKGNFHCSLYLKIDDFYQNFYELSFLASLAVCDALKATLTQTEPFLKIKWPNDLFLDQEKLGGILLEYIDSSPALVGEYGVIGVGININKAPHFNDYKTTSLKTLFPNAAIDLKIFLSHYLNAFQRLFELWGERGFDPILHRWQQLIIHREGDLITIQKGLHQEIVKFKHISADGSLIYYDTNGHLQKHIAGDVLI